MKPLAPLAALALLLAAAAAEAGDPEAGEGLFNRCRACHMIEGGGETIVRGGPTGPNLYGVIGRRAGSVAGFDYGDSLAEAGEAGLVWTEETLAAYVSDPRKFLSERLGGRARSNMTYKLRRGGEDVAAYLAQFGAGG